MALEENTFILFLSSNEYYIYDVKANSLINTHEIKYMKYSSGFIFYTSYYYHLYDLKNNEEYTYDVNGLIAPNTTYFGAFANDNLYQISNNTNSIETYNTKNNKVSSFDISSYLKYPISNFENKEDTLLMTTFLDEEFEFIVIEMANHKLKEKNIYDFLTDQNKEITETIKAIKDKYNVNIKIKDEGEIIFPDFKSESLYTNSVIKSTLKKVEHILSKFPDNFFNQFHHDTYKGLNIYLSGSLTPSYPETQVSNPVAYTLMQDYSYTIVLDSFYSELENTVCHELMHAMENNLKNKKKKIFTQWNSLNPKGFNYYDAYNVYREYYYIPDMTSKDKVYFVSSYSYTYDIEDRAEIFGKMCSEDSNDDIKQYPKLYKKAQAIRDELIKQYPELGNSVFLNNYK